jgi:hypothetical protein
MPGSSDDERQDDLAATAESIREDANRVAEIEEQKQDLDVDDPRVDSLSIEAEGIAGQIQRKSRIERGIAADDPSPGQARDDRAN